MRGPAASGAAASSAEQWLARTFLSGGGSAGPLAQGGGGGLPLGPAAALFGGLLSKAARLLAGKLGEESRLGRVIHYNLQARLAGSPTIRAECGRGAVLGLPETFSSVTTAASGGVDAAGGEQRTLVSLDAPILHPRLGDRGRLHVEALVLLPFVAEEGSDAAAAAAVALAAQRALRRAERAARLADEPASPVDEPPAARRLRTTLRFLSDAAEDLEDEARVGGARGRLTGVTIEVTRAVLRAPGGTTHDVTAEIGGIFYDDVTQRAAEAPTAATGAGGPGAGGGEGGRVIDAEFFSRKR